MPIHSLGRRRLALFEVNTVGSHIASVRFEVTGSDEIRVPVFVIDEFFQTRYVRRYVRKRSKYNANCRTTYNLCLSWSPQALVSIAGTHPVWV